MDTEQIEITRPVSAIVMFGPPSQTDGFRIGTYHQCVIDPNMVSPGGGYIRFESTTQNGELHGWQRIEAITVCEILGDAPEQKYPEGVTVSDDAKVTVRAIVKE